MKYVLVIFFVIQIIQYGLQQFKSTAGLLTSSALNVTFETCFVIPDVPWLVSSGQALWIKFTSDEMMNQGFFSLNVTMQGESFHSSY